MYTYVCAGFSFTWCVSLLLYDVFKYILHLVLSLLDQEKNLAAAVVCVLQLSHLLFYLSYCNLT